MEYLRIIDGEARIRRMERLIRSEFEVDTFVVGIQLFYFFSFFYDCTVLCMLFVGSRGL